MSMLSAILINVFAPLQLDMPHALSAALEEPGRVGKRSVIVEAHRGVARESIDVSEGGFADAGGWAAVVNQLADIATAVANPFEPRPAR